MGPQVLHEAGAALEALVTLRTPEGGLRGVSQQVLRQVGALAEAVAAEVAGVGPLVCVRAHVQPEDGTAPKNLPAPQTLEGARLWVGSGAGVRLELVGLEVGHLREVHATLCTYELRLWQGLWAICSYSDLHDFTALS